MKANIIAIGDRKGLIIPSSLLRKLKITNKTTVTITLHNDEIVIKPIRQGWESAAKEMNERGDDKPLLDESFSSFEKEEWEW